MLDPGEGLVGRVFAEKRVLTYDAPASRAARDPFAERFPDAAGHRGAGADRGEAGGVLFAGRQDLGRAVHRHRRAPCSWSSPTASAPRSFTSGCSSAGAITSAHLRELRGLVDAATSRARSRARSWPASPTRAAGWPGCAGPSRSPARPERVGVLRRRAGLLAQRRARSGSARTMTCSSRASPPTGRWRSATSRPGGPRAPACFEEEGIRAALLVPMRARGRVVGLLCLADLGAAGLLAGGDRVRPDARGPDRGALETERQLGESRHALAERDAERGRPGAGRADARVLAALGAGAHARAPPGLRDPRWAARSSCSRAPRTIRCAKGWSRSRKPPGAAPISSSGCSDWRRPISAARSPSCPAIAQEAVSFARARLQRGAEVARARSR